MFTVNFAFSNKDASYASTSSVQQAIPAGSVQIFEAKVPENTINTQYTVSPSFKQVAKQITVTENIPLGNIILKYLSV